MSISYQELHTKALEYLPDSKIKPTSTWVGILVHSVPTLKDLTANSDILWLKCHGRITVRTLKHEYFSRHPLESFEFKFCRRFLEDTTQVKHLRRRNPIKSQVVILRAFDEEDIEAEQDLEQEIEDAKTKAADLKEKSVEADDDVMQSTEQTEADVEDGREHTEEADDEAFSASEQRSVSQPVVPRKRKLSEEGESVEHEELPTKDAQSAREHAESEEASDEGDDSSSEEKPASLDQDQPSSQSDLPTSPKTENSNDGVQAEFMEEEESPSIEDIVAESRRKVDESLENMDNADPQFFEEWRPFYARLTSLPAPFNAIDVNIWQSCEFCGYYFFVKHYTLMGPDGCPLCYGCTQNHYGGEDLGYYRKFAALEFLQKRHLQDNLNQQQDLSPHARLNHPDDMVMFLPRQTGRMIYLANRTNGYVIKPRPGLTWDAPGHYESDELIPKFGYEDLYELGFDMDKYQSESMEESEVQAATGNEDDNLMHDAPSSEEEQQGDAESGHNSPGAQEDDDTDMHNSTSENHNVEINGTLTPSETGVDRELLALADGSDSDGSDGEESDSHPSDVVESESNGSDGDESD